MSRLIELPAWVLAVTVVTDGAIGGGTVTAITLLTARTRGRQP